MLDNTLLDNLKKIPLITPVVNVLEMYSQGTLDEGFKDEVSIEEMRFRIKGVPYKDINTVYQTIDTERILESFKGLINIVGESIHTKYLIHEMGAWNQCMEANLDRFTNPVNILYLKHHYIAKCLFLYLTCGR